MTQRELESRLAKLEALLPATQAVPLVVATPTDDGYAAQELPGLTRTFNTMADLLTYYGRQGTFVITHPEPMEAQADA